MFTSALVQYNSVSRSVSANVRLRWEYQPGSELFIVYNEQRDTQPTVFPQLSNRAVESFLDLRWFRAGEA